MNSLDKELEAAKQRIAELESDQCNQLLWRDSEIVELKENAKAEKEALEKKLAEQQAFIAFIAKQREPDGTKPQISQQAEIVLLQRVCFRDELNKEVSAARKQGFEEGYASRTLCSVTVEESLIATIAQLKEENLHHYSQWSKMQDLANSFQSQLSATQAREAGLLELLSIVRNCLDCQDCIAQIDQALSNSTSSDAWLKERDCALLDKFHDATTKFVVVNDKSGEAWVSLDDIDNALSELRASASQPKASPESEIDQATRQTTL